MAKSELQPQQSSMKGTCGFHLSQPHHLFHKHSAWCGLSHYDRLACDAGNKMHKNNTLLSCVSPILSI